MTGTFRTASGGRIDRTKPIKLRFDNREYTGYAGDTLASALLAHGVHVFGRSFKYHRPRGVMTAGAEEPNALVRVGRTEDRVTPNVRATQVEIHEGLVAESQNRFPSLAFDVGAVNDVLSPFFPAGFYYKTFMWPAWAWKKIYEPAIRRAAGLGRAPSAPDADIYAQRYAHCDVLVVGAGPAGLAAALSAAQSGARVMLCDEQQELGGSLLSETDATQAGKTLHAWRAETLASLARTPNVTILPRTTAFGVFAQNFIALSERVTDHLAAPDPASPRERLWQVRARQLILATGAIERPMLFPGNDRPGIMLAGAARTYLHRYGVKSGSRAVLVTENDAAYGAAVDLARAGIKIVAVIDPRREAPGPLAHAAKEAGITIKLGATIAATHGRSRIHTVSVTGSQTTSETIGCDLLLMSGGYTPSVHLFSQSRGKLRFDASLGAYLPEGDTDQVIVAGACRNVFSPEAAIADGTDAGINAVARAGFGKANLARRTVVAVSTPGHNAASVPNDDHIFVDFQNDVTTKDIRLAVREGFVSIEHVKRYTTTGMATDQGKTSNVNALGLVAEERHTELPNVGLTTFRMPYTPVTFGTLAGAARAHLFDPVRQTPAHGWAEQHGAVFEDVGLWKRARYFPAPGESMSQAVARECRAVRASAGIFDASTLGKIEVTGPDAAIFLERMYVNGFRKLAPGRARYGIMLREDGFIQDDGVIGRLAHNRFHVTTTTGGAPRVLSVMEDYLQTEWPDLRVWLTSTTEQWAVIAIQGPRARDIIAPLVEGIDLSQQSFPHMAVAEGKILGAKLRVFRVSFTGELGFELNVPADYGAAVWNAILHAGVPFGLTPYGTETMHVLRAEKGYIVVGQETDGTATPDDVGLAWAINLAKGDFVGKRSLSRAAMTDPARKQLVGLLPESPTAILEEGAPIVAASEGPVARQSIGHVTSSYFSTTLGRSIALAMVSGGRSRTEQTLFVPVPSCTTKVRATSPVFYDPQGERING